MTDEQLAKIDANHAEHCVWLSDKGFDPTECSEDGECPISALLTEIEILQAVAAQR